MFRKGPIISAFDIEGSLIKLAQIAVDEQPYLYRLSARRANTEAVNELAKTLRQLAGDSGVSGTRIVVSLPRHRLTVKNLKLPSVASSEIESMVNLQAAKQLPYPPDKIVSGFKILTKDKDGYADIMMALAHRDAVDNILKVFDSAGLEVEKLVVSSEGLSEWYVQRQKDDEKTQSVCLVDIGSSVLEMLVVMEGRLDFSRAITIPPSGNIQEVIVDEIRKTIFTYKKSFPQRSITKLVLTGRRSILKNEAAALKKEVGLQTVYVDTLMYWPKKDAVMLPNEDLLTSETFTTVISLGFNCDRLETNLIPQQMRLERLSKITKESLMVLAALSLSILLGIGGIITKNFIDKKRFLNYINKRVDETKPQAEKLKRFKDIIDVIKKQLEMRGSSIDVMRELYNKVPPEISLTIFDYEDNASCLLRGTSQKLSEVFKFISTLEESPYFENVKVRYASKRAVGKEELTDFEIICELSQIGSVKEKD